MASVLTMDLLDENGDSAEEPEEEDEVNSVKGAAQMQITYFWCPLCLGFWDSPLSLSLSLCLHVKRI